MISFVSKEVYRYVRADESRSFKWLYFELHSSTFTRWTDKDLGDYIHNHSGGYRLLVCVSGKMQGAQNYYL